MKVCEPYTIFLRTLPSGKQVYYYQFRDEYGRRSAPRSTGCTKLAQARRFCQKLYNEGLMGAESSLKFSSFTDGFFTENSYYSKWKSINNREVTPTTLQSYNKILRNQILPFFKDIPLNRISTSTVKEWIIWMSDKWSAKTTNNAQTVLNIILRTAHEKNLISSVPSLNLSFRKTQKLDRNILTLDEVKAVYYSPLWKSDMYRRIFLLDVITGMRIGEVMALQPADIKEKCLDVRHTYNDKFGIGDTKTKITRYVPVPDGFFGEVATTWVFQRQDDEIPLPQHEIYKNLMRILDEMGIDHKGRKITLHTVRNFFISYLESKNVPEPKIRAIVGHKEKTMTDIYTYWKPEMFPEVYEAQSELYNFILQEGTI